MLKKSKLGEESRLINPVHLAMLLSMSMYYRLVSALTDVTAEKDPELRSHCTIVLQYIQLPHTDNQVYSDISGCVTPSPFDSSCCSGTAARRHGGVPRDARSLQRERGADGLPRCTPSALRAL